MRFMRINPIVVLVLVFGLSIGLIPTYTEAKEQEPFQVYFPGSIEPGEAGTGSSLVFDVPAEKLLVIETITIGADLPCGQTIISFGIRTFVDDDSAWHYISVFNQGCNSIGRAKVSGCEKVRIYAESGRTVLINIKRSETAETTGFGISVSGYLSK
jgi:hypothetical protein